jgi:hypothetical protein
MRLDAARHSTAALALAVLLATGAAVWAQATLGGGDPTMADGPPAPLAPGLGSLPLLTDCETRSVSAENPTGEKGRGGMAIPDPSDPSPAASARAADDLGQGWKVRPFLRVNAGETAVLMDVDGPGVIQHIWMVEGLSRAHVLRFYWDDEETPSIEVPAPDFFAVGHEMFARVNSAAVVVNPRNALNCYWPMPFRRHARVTLTNEASEDLVLVAYQITYAITDVPASAGTFHAQWRRASTETTNPYVILDGVRGRGRYVGTFLAWTQLRAGWFGEGEVKFYLDGDREFPTICGTGTEDYFCGSYGFPEVYTTPYAGTVLAGDENAPPPSYWSLYRWHIPDPICFREDLRVTIQALGWGPDGKYLRQADDIASVAYWYQAEPHAPFPALPAPNARRRWERTPVAVEGALEGEGLTVLACTGGKVEPQDLRFAPWGWSREAHLFWLDGQPGDALSLSVPVQAEGTYALRAQLTKAPDYAVVRLLLDGKPLGEPIDLYAPVAAPGGELALGEHRLSAGEHELRVEIVGANEQAAKRHGFGLDYLLLAPVR